MTYKKLIEECKSRGVKFIDIRFCDLIGAWQHFSIPIRELNEKVFLDGLGFDGSSIRGCKEIESSDMVIVPDINTFFIDSFKKDLTGVFIGDIYEFSKKRFGDNGSGMHVHISLWKKGTNLFYEKKGYAGLSKTAIYFIGGLIKHADSLMAFAAPTVNSYKRLLPGYEAPVNLAYSASNRSAAIRIPMYDSKIEAKRIEFRPPDPSANPYLAFSAILMAGIDGIVNRIDPGIPFDKNIYTLTSSEKSKIKKIPSSLDEALAALENDHSFLLTGDVFSENLIKFWIEYKRMAECDFVNTRISPAEFILYYNS